MTDQPAPPPSDEPADEVELEEALEDIEELQDQLEELEELQETGRHATNLELFLDLVFVFAVTQIAGQFADDRTPLDFGKGLLLAWLVWWLWSQFAWLGTAVDLTERSKSQYLVLATVPMTLLMSVAIPNAYGSTGLEFAGAYLAVNLWCLTIQGRAMWNDPTNRAAWLSYAPLASAAPFVLFAGCLVHGNARASVWAAAAALTVFGALSAGSSGDDGTNEWRIDPVHFAERHALFVIISLGEVLVAVGSAATDADLSPKVAGGVVATVAAACAMWWIYFAYVPKVVERSLRNAHGPDRGRMARDRFTFGHFPIILGVVLFAVPARVVAAAPTASLSSADRFALAAGIVSFVGGLMALQWVSVHRVAPERVVVIVATVAWCAVGGRVSGTVLIAVLAVGLGAMHAVTLRRLGRSRPLATR